VIDLETPRLVGSVSTGRGGIKFAKALGAIALSAAATASSYYQGQTVARTQGHNSFMYNVYSFGVAAPESDLVVGPDGRFVYALNTQTNDVTIVDSASAGIVSKESAKGRSLASLADGRRFAVLGKDELRVFDMETQRAGEPLRFDGSDEVRLVFSKDRTTALAWGGKTLHLLEASGSSRATVPGLESVGPVMFDDGGLSQQVAESTGRESR
jgi:hypothetical protein